MQHPMTLADWLIRALTAAAVVLLGGIAAVVSYSHALEVALEHGQTGWTAQLTPLTIDGLVLVPGLVMLDSARRDEEAPWLAWVALALGIGATLAVNVLYGLDYGPIGAAVAGWPAVALVLSHHLLMGMIRRGRLSSHSPVRDESRDECEAAWASVRKLMADVAPRPAAAPVLAAAARPELPALPPLDLAALLERPATGQTVPAVPVPAAVASVPWLAPPALVGDEEPEPGHGFGHVDEAVAAGQAPVADLDSAIVSARRAGRLVREVMAEFGVSKHRIGKAMKTAGA